ncbi:MAG TPA: Arm DNA-binding domain-containing protein, partial [Rhizomicrobium sp.]|nr:Arm DNA-binding domain-containing protein [Rhizomicrobium sp.]
MAGRSIERLKALKIERELLKTPGMYCDGGGLWLCVSSPTSASWLFRYQLQGKARAMGLGPARDISLHEARTAAAAARKVKAMGSDPLQERARIVADRRAEAARAITFRQSAEAYFKAHGDTWRAHKHRVNWMSTLQTYAYPTIGDVSVAAIDREMIVNVLEPIWRDKTATASRLRGRIEAVLDWAAAKGYRTDENPARWKGALSKLFPTRERVRKVEHYPALPYRDMPAFIAALKGQGGDAAQALLFTILTAARTGE